MGNDNCGKGRPKPGVDWTAIEAAVRGGASYHSLEKLFPVSRQRIGKVAREKGWVNGGVSPAVSTGVSVEGAISVESILAQPYLEVRKGQNWGVLNNANIETIIALISEGFPEASAVRICGIAHRTWQDRCSKHPDLKALVDGAKEWGVLRRFKGVMDGGKRGDWRADKELLGMNPDTSDDYGEKRGSKDSGQLIVNINIQDPVEISATIDVPSKEIA